MYSKDELMVILMGKDLVCRMAYHLVFDLVVDLVMNLEYRMVPSSVLKRVYLLGEL